LLTRPEWRESTHGPALTRVVSDALTADDRVDRLHAASAIRFIEPEPQRTLALLRARLLAEPEPHVAAVLTNELAALANDAPDAVDAVLGEVAENDIWQARLAAPGGSYTLEPLLSLALWLAISREAAVATELVQEWCAKPILRPAGRRLFGLLRPWLELPVARADERKRAFDLVRSAALSIEADRTSTDPPEAVELYRLADAIVSQLYFASGAFGTRRNSERTPAPAAEGFAAEAFDVIEHLTEFREPGIVHHIVQTLAHLAPADPRTAFLLVDRAIRAGDAYTYDGMAANETVTLVARYLADFREIVSTDADVLTAVRRVLDAFVRVGWPAAVALSYRLGEAFR
jgi:hypothetical protein